MGKWDPVKDVFSLRERVNRLFEDVPSRPGEVEPVVWAPVVDIYETPEEFVVTAELPDVNETDINIRVEDNMLRISGERRSHREGKSYYQVERYSGVFSRSFILPSTVDRNSIKATLKDGILNIVLPKKAEELPKHIEIK
ncbi:MAG: Hsp20/alpha crystallin family protein [Nitrospirae bacterium]|nr:Hsp20/alpha crystallin family protein [Nitrospirota bacterium]